MERNLRIDAIVLSSRKWGELHRMVTLLSGELGLCDAVAYGARKGKLAGALELGTIGTFYLYHNPTKHEYSIKDAEPRHTNDPIRGDLLRLYISQALVEMAMRMHGGDYEALYRVLGGFLVLLDQSCVDPRLVFIQYIWKFIVIMGLEPDLISCPICGTPYNDKERLSFNTGLHTPCCGDCGDVDSEGFEYALGPGGRRYLLYTQGLSESDAVVVPLSVPATIRMARYMVRYVTNILGRPLSSLSGGILMEALGAY
jgi:DNA repair protein RecO (recombination protein O)